MFKRIKQTLAASRILDEQYYIVVHNELENGIKRKGIWAKALADSGGSDNKAKSLYIRYRVQSIKDELELQEVLSVGENQLPIQRSVMPKKKRGPLDYPEYIDLSSPEAEVVDKIETYLHHKGLELVATGTGWIIANTNTGKDREIKSYDELIAFYNTY
jgi:hypothetical protein